MSLLIRCVFRDSIQQQRIDYIPYSKVPPTPSHRTDTIYVSTSCYNCHPYGPAARYLEVHIYNVEQKEII